MPGISLFFASALPLPRAQYPVAGNPVAGNPVAGNPVAGNPVAGNPVAGNSVAGDPAVRWCLAQRSAHFAAFGKLAVSHCVDGVGTHLLTSQLAGGCPCGGNCVLNTSSGAMSDSVLLDRFTAGGAHGHCIVLKEGTFARDGECKSIASKCSSEQSSKGDVSGFHDSFPLGS